VGTSDGLDILDKKKLYCPCWESNHGSVAMHPVAWSPRGLCHIVIL